MTAGLSKIAAAIVNFFLRISLPSASPAARHAQSNARHAVMEPDTGDTASRCRIGHLPFPVHSRRLRWTLSGFRRGRAAYLAGLTTMTS